MFMEITPIDNKMFYLRQTLYGYQSLLQPRLLIEHSESLCNSISVLRSALTQLDQTGKLRSILTIIPGESISIVSRGRSHLTSDMVQG